LGYVFAVKIAPKAENYRPIWDRCYDFLNILAEKFGKKLAFLLKTKLN
jgi:hypothetical protein